MGREGGGRGEDKQIFLFFIIRGLKFRADNLLLVEAPSISHSPLAPCHIGWLRSRPALQPEDG
jgi:hypothetical protein